MTEYAQIAKEARKKVLELIFKAQTSHIGSCLSAIDIMAVLFEKADPKNDEVILSAGWKAAAWYYFLWRKGIITEEELNSFCQPNSPFIGLTEPLGRWGLRFGGGSMGMGFSAAVGFALAKKLKGEEGKVYVLMSDGEIQCGQTWESSLIAAHYKLDNLIVICDFNEFQAMGKIKDILGIEPLTQKFNNFGWMARVLDGHNYKLIEQMVSYPMNEGYKPLFVMALTIKGKGVSFMENNNDWHYMHLSAEDYEKALAELNE